MGFSQDDVEKVKEATDFLAIVGEITQLKRSGRTWKGLCPFHTERTPSFTVSEEGWYRCFGCGAKGDTITFLRETQSLTHLEAVQQLADAAGIKIQQTKPTKEDLERSKLLHIIEDATEYYHLTLCSSPEAAAARKYLRSRGYDSDTVKQYKLGWAPDAYDWLAQELGANKQPNQKYYINAGLGRVQGGRPVDFFQGRIIFPIFSDQNKPVAFAGRILPGAQGAKYKNSPSSAIYNKSKLLYGLNWAKSHIVKEDSVFICEGYTDLIGFSKAKKNNAVATCGTAVTEEHIEKLSRYTKNLILVLDGDQAGSKATQRLKYLHSYESRHDVEARVVEMPTGTDPGELAENDPAFLLEVLNDTSSLIEFNIRKHLANQDMSTPQSRNLAAKTCAKEAAIHLLHNHHLQSEYIDLIASRCSVDNKELLSFVREYKQEEYGRLSKKGTGQRLPPDAKGVKSSPPSKASINTEDNDRQAAPLRLKIERKALWLAVHHPEYVSEDVNEDSFVYKQYRDVFNALLSYDSFEDIITKSDRAIAAIIEGLLNEQDTTLSSDTTMQNKIMSQLANTQQDNKNKQQPPQTQTA